MSERVLELSSAVFAQPGKPVPASKAGRGLRWASLKFINRASHPAQAWAGMASPSLTFQGDSHAIRFS